MEGNVMSPEHETLLIDEPDGVLSAPGKVAYGQEALLLALAGLAFTRVGSMLRVGHMVYQATEDKLEAGWQQVRNPKVAKDVTANNLPYELSVFGALEQPTRGLLGVLTVTHFFGLFMPSLFGSNEVWLMRKAGLVLALNWFAFTYKRTLLQRAIKSHSADRDRYLALDKLGTIGLVSFALLSLGEVVGFAFKSLLTVGGISGIAAGMAAKEVVGNAFGGAMLYLTRPFKVGEFIKTNVVTGKVLDIGFYSTKILSTDRVITYVPNSIFTCMVITNLSRQENRILEGTFALRLKDIALVDEITADIRTFLRTNPAVDKDEQPPRAFMGRVTPFFIELGVHCVANPMGYDQFLEAKQNLLVQIGKIIVKHGAVMGAPPNSLVSTEA